MTRENKRPDNFAAPSSQNHETHTKFPELNRFLPDLGTLTLVIVPILLFIKPEAMLQDPGIGWHLISGHYMLDHKTILDHDIFSFTRPEQPWIIMEWLFQCFAAALDKIGGLPLLSVVTALIYGSLPILLHQWQEFASPDFNYGGITSTIFLFLTIFILSYREKNSMSLFEFTFLLFFLYHASHALRHVFLFALLTIPPSLPGN